MRVVIVNQYAVPPDFTGSTRHYSIARLLHSNGIDVRVVCSNVAYRSGTVIADGQENRDYSGVEFAFLDAQKSKGGKISRVTNMLSFAHALRRYLQNDTIVPDVIVGSTPTLFSAYVALRHARAIGAKYILEVRDIWPQTIIDLGGYSRRNPAIVALRQLEKYLYHSADHIVTVLPLAADHITKYGVSSDKVTWIPNGIDLNIVPTNLEVPSRDSANFLVTYAGAHGTANALDSILDAAKHLITSHSSRYHLRFIGAGPAKDALQQRVISEGITNVTFQEPVPKAEVYALLAESDALIVNMHEGSLYRYGISFQKLFDYMSVSRPIVFGVSSEYDPVKESGAGISVHANDSSAMAAAIVELDRIGHVERARRGALGRDFVEQHHDIEGLGMRMVDVIETVLKD